MKEKGFSWAIKLWFRFLVPSFSARSRRMQLPMCWILISVNWQRRHFRQLHVVNLLSLKHRKLYKNKSTKETKQKEIFDYLGQKTC